MNMDVYVCLWHRLACVMLASTIHISFISLKDNRKKNDAWQDKITVLTT